MNVRNILVAASAAAILAGTSFGALAYQGHGFSKGESGSVIVVYSTADSDSHDSDVVIFGLGMQEAISKNGGGKATAGSKTWGMGGSSQTTTTWSNPADQNVNNGITYNQNGGESGSSTTQASSSWAAGGTSGFASAGGH